MKTLLLDRTTWDLCLDANGNLAVASDPYSQAQDVASACLAFFGEVWYNTTLGVMYKTKILGFKPSIPFFKDQMVTQALTVPGVVSAQCFVQGLTNREFTGQIQFTNTEGETTVVPLSAPFNPNQQAVVTDTGAFVVTDTGAQVVT